MIMMGVPLKCVFVPMLKASTPLKSACRNNMLMIYHVATKCSHYAHPKGQGPPLVLWAGVVRHVQATHGRIARAERQRAVPNQAAARCVLCCQLLSQNTCLAAHQ